MLDKNIEVLATFLEEHCCCEPQYVIPFTHEELIDILLRIRDGHVLTENEYDLIMMLIGSEDNENIGDVLFSGNYLDLINKPFIPSKMEDLKDYPAIMGRLNTMFNSLSEKDKAIMESVDDIARFLSLLEVTMTDEVDRLTKLVEACRLFEGESLNDVIAGIQSELGWLDEIKEDIAEGKALSEKDFTAAYEQILQSINNTEEGLVGFIKQVIKDSIKDPGKPNGNGVFTLDTIGEALASKIDKRFDGYDLSQNDFTDEYKAILDDVLNNNNETNLREFVISIVEQYEEVFKYYITDIGDSMIDYTQNAVQDMRLYVDKKTDEIRDIVEEVKDEAFDSVKFDMGEGPVSINIGGLKKGTNIEERSVKDVLLELICPFVYPEVSAELSLAYPQYLYEIGEVVKITGIAATLENGSLPIERIVFKERIGNTYKIIGAYASSQTYHWFPEVYELTHTIDDKYFMVEVEDSEGNRAECGAGSINFVYPIFYGTFKPDTEITESSVKGLYKQLKYMGEECKYEYTTNNEEMVLAVPEDYGTVIDIIDQNGYIITNSFKVDTINLRFTAKEKVGDSYSENEYIKRYYVYHNNPNSVYGFEITYKF